MFIQYHSFGKINFEIYFNQPKHFVLTRLRFAYWILYLMCIELIPKTFLFLPKIWNLHPLPAWFANSVTKHLNLVYKTASGSTSMLSLKFPTLILVRSFVDRFRIPTIDALVCWSYKNAKCIIIIMLKSHGRRLR